MYACLNMNLFFFEGGGGGERGYIAVLYSILTFHPLKGDRLREEFFLSSLRRLQKAARDQFKKLQQQCGIEQSTYDEKYPKIMMKTQDNKFEGLKEHKLSKALLPGDYPSPCFG